MKYWKIFFSCICLLLLVSCSLNTQAEIEKKQVEANEENDKIVATTLAITEIMDALNLDLVGIPTTQYDIPARYKNVTEVGNPMSPDMEIIQSLQPTDVLSVTTLEYDLKDSFDQMNLSAQFLKLDSVENMLDTIIELGNKYERMTEAAELRSSIEKKMESIKKQTEQEKTPTVLILLGVPGGSYLVATENSYVGNLVEVVGGKNAVTGQSAEYISANTEYLQQTNADVILRLSHGVPEQVAEEFQKEFSENDIWKHFNAVKNNRVFDLQEPIFATTANLNIKEAMDQLVEMLYE
ncbi:heme ABC transporter substrate-binding protein IsdE [Cytobacillus oceanisediminis]|uniref:High-affinity heme uptake system protein IsdE n=1 Tax=Niallia alba TaxID=2729105 RepID=A0A7Y0K679_9BACI|nr:MULTISPECIES: heme ABC transporter substrate-binding protein IsdE [Bacillaceae]MBQ6448962.1 heme ABC transporter substrate-binding protein IsdE [Bacillus sp. (in: firmicutes)]MBZ9536366.1 heme ABC transporter substrate-binding protein IsdE [Cytobacillus oceanisediminis]NMO76542.1 heme ABC transporter substrate-binding protein IsdE [Niallia alba]UTI44260.1 heme ABC transporter substrate-binding protein IsdE [Niallia sp. RD1]